jgi:hypothetical protein
VSVIELRWNPPLESWQQKLGHLVASGIYESVGKLAADVKPMLLEAVRDKAPRRTGQYADSLTATQQVEGRGVTIRIMGPNPLSTWITAGTRPHEIYPVNAKALRFELAGGGIVFAKHVSHPGTQPNPYPMRGWEAARGDVLDRAGQWGREIVVEMRP